MREVAVQSKSLRRYLCSLAHARGGGVGGWRSGGEADGGGAAEGEEEGKHR